MKITDTSMVNAFVPGATRLSEADEALVVRRQRLLGPAYRLMYANPVHFVRGEGVWMFDRDGAAYLDVYNNVASVGHCHPRVVEAMARQAANLSTNTRYLHEAILDYADALISHFPDPLAHLMFTCTGSEANDLALRIARDFTGGTGIIVTKNAYHGVTQAVSEMSPSLGQHVALGAHVRAVSSPDLYRSPTENVGAEFRESVERAIEDLQRHGIKPAVLIVDTVFSSDGVLPEPAGFLEGAVEAIRAVGGLFVADEVQPGFGRTGAAMWGFQRHGVVPDMVSIGKPMGNGYPVAGLVMTPEVIAGFGAKARYFNTFGGNTVAVATAQAVLDVITGENLQDNAHVVGDYLRVGLERIASEADLIGDVRAAGLFLGVEIVSDKQTKAPDAAATSRIVNGLLAKRVLISATGRRANVLKIRPPLVFSKENADVFLDRFREVIHDLA